MLFWLIVDNSILLLIKKATSPLRLSYLSFLIGIKLRKEVTTYSAITQIRSQVMILEVSAASHSPIPWTQRMPLRITK